MSCLRRAHNIVVRHCDEVYPLGLSQVADLALLLRCPQLTCTFAVPDSSLMLSPLDLGAVCLKLRSIHTRNGARLGLG